MLNIAGINVDTANVAALSIQDMTMVYNALVPADKQIKKFSQKSKGLERLQPLLAAHVRSEKANGEKTEPKDKPEASGRRRSPMAMNTRIELLVAENPKKAGSKAAARFAKLQTGMTVEKARAVGITPEDLRYDAKKGYIKLEPEQVSA